MMDHSLDEKLKSLDYRSILAGGVIPRSPRERYVLARAAIILGQFKDAEKILCAHDHWAGADERFLRLQLGLYRDGAVDETIACLDAEDWSELKDDYLEGELNFVRAYAHHQRDEYLQAIRYNEQALLAYERAGLPGHAAIVSFNLAVAYNHLSDARGFQAHLDRLTKAEQVTRLAVVRWHRQRLEIYQATDREEYEVADALCAEVLEAYRREGRLNDYAGLATLRGYLLLKLGRHAEFAQLSQEVSRGAAEAPSLLASFFAMARDVACSFPMPQEVGAWQDRILASEIHGVNKLFLFDLLATAAERASCNDELIALADAAERFSRQSQQSLSLVDFTKYRIMGLIQSGQIDDARAWLLRFESKALLSGATRRLKFACGLKSQLEALTKPRGLTDATCVTLDTKGHRLIIGAEEISLAAQPVIEKFLGVLFAHRKGLAVADAFQLVYGTSYKPLQHEARLKTVIDRARRLCGLPGFILRRGGSLSIASAFRVQVLPSPGESMRERRRESLLRLLESASQPVGVAALAKGTAACGASRRTIQDDLRALAREKRIEARGRSRNRRYTLGEQR